MTGIAVSPAAPVVPAAPAAPAAPSPAPIAPVAGNEPAAPAPAAPAAPGIVVGSPDPAAPAAPAIDTPWYASLKDDGIKAFAEGKKWATVDDALKSHKELETAFSGKLEALAPKTAAEYQFKKPDNIPAEVGYNDTFAGNFKNWAFARKLSNEQAAGIHDEFVKFATESVNVQTQERQRKQGESIVKAETALKQEWGAPENPSFQRSMEMARRTMVQAGLSNEDLVAAGVLTDVGGRHIVTNAKIMSFFAKVGNAMYAEDSTYSKSVTSNENPFAAATLNLKAQGDLYNKDPQRAAMLIDSLPPNERAQQSALRAALKAKGF